jgi:SAM-dependent methyltransferase
VFEELLTTYQRLEPPGSDTWNPLHDDTELWHRVRLYLELRRALSLIPKSPDTIRVLDVGCGTGRSTRALLEFGVRPDNVLGLDLRKSAIEYARALNPAISYLAISGLESWPVLEGFDLCMQCTAFSSILKRETRAAVARKMAMSVTPGGYVYWWDMIRANGFAGGDLLEPLELFHDLVVLLARNVSLQPSLAEAIGPGIGRRLLGLSILRGRLGFSSTHCSALFQRPGP